MKYLWRVSKKGVPHVVFQGQGLSSICYMARTKVFRVFSDFSFTEHNDQKRYDFVTFEDAVHQARKLAS